MHVLRSLPSLISHGLSGPRKGFCGLSATPVAACICLLIRAPNGIDRLVFGGLIAIFKAQHGGIARMKLRVGYEMNYEFPQPTPVIMVLGTHFTRASDVIVPDFLTTSPVVPITPYRDSFGNWCSRIVAPAGAMRLFADGVVRDSGLPDPVDASAQPARGRGAAGGDAGLSARQPLLRDRPAVGHRLEAVRHDAAGLGARAGDLRLRASATSPSAMSTRAPPRPRGRPSTSGTGVCRDYAHLAIAFCRCLNIPARYCTGYLGDIGVPPPGRRWISPAGSRSISAAAGTPSIRATTSRGSAAS